ncbi:PilZ domain-containing protein [Bradyrhizobium sp.]|uniref:PilZ domain-containing protein n=1 Tax=Bradyrhizobium sp. TaxID=376 RepID=UPI0027374985|nr:PilZ domain-containing protein [Bradyrhizobium sp.]MDP3691965.1 PilZ domain-containing protein [Bradyrhizobium sp.]
MSVETFLKQRAVNLAVTGSYTLPNWYDPQGRLRTFACRTTRISPFRMMVDVPVVGKVGDRLSAYFRDFGNFDASISETRAGLFLIELEMTRPMREKFASKLTWLEKKQKEPGLPDLRRDARIIPTSPHSTLTLADGTTQECFVIDMSSSGVAVSAQLQPQIGTPLAVGACIGRVVRLQSDGFAVKFVEPLNRHELERRLVTRFAPPALSGHVPAAPRRSGGVLPAAASLQARGVGPDQTGL